MILSELIQLLEKNKADHGDIEVEIRDTEEGFCSGDILGAEIKQHGNSKDFLLINTDSKSFAYIPNCFPLP